MRETVRRTLNARLPRTRSAPATLGWSQFSIVVTGIALVFTFIFLLNPLHWYDKYAELAIRRFGVPFGFKVGDVVVRSNGDQWKRWGVVAVVPGGALERAGVRAGDVPFGRHSGGFLVFYHALTEAAAGRTGTVDMINAADYTVGRLRTITVPPLDR